MILVKYLMHFVLYSKYIFVVEVPLHINAAKYLSPFVKSEFKFSKINGRR